MNYNENGQDNQNNNQWDRWNSNASNSSYYNQPTHRPYRQGFMIASGICGLLAVSTCCTGIFPLIFGSLGILFAVLAYRKGQKLNNSCKLGIITSIAGILGGIFLIVYSLVTLPTMLQDEAYRAQLDAMMDSAYGMDLDTFLEFYGYSIGE